jgi:hypothetical protein
MEENEFERQRVVIIVEYTNDYYDPSKNEVFRQNDVWRWQWKKYEWYWNYLRALAVVKRPKAKVTLSLSFYYPDKQGEVVEIKNKIAGAKRMISKLGTGIEELKEFYKKELFPNEYLKDPLYQKAICKLGDYKIKLENLEHQLKEL